MSLLKKVLAHIYYHGDPKTKRILNLLEGKKPIKSKLKPLPKGQRTLVGNSRSTADPSYTPSWEDLYSKLSIAVDNDIRLKKTLVSGKKRKRKANENKEEEEAQQIPKGPTTSLRPPDTGMLDKALDRINFNMKYWQTIPGMTQKVVSSASASQ
jgi:hypothetical protein